MGQSFLTVILTHADARGVEQQLAYLGELAPASRFAVVHGGERSEFEKLGADALFVDDPHLRRYGEISLNRVVVSAHERWVAGDPEIELVYVLEYDLLVLRPDFEQTLAGLAKRTGAGLLGKAAGPRNDTNWPHYLSYRGNDSFNRFIEGVSRREDREVRLGCFGPGMLYSREAFDAVASAMGDAPPAFHELMLPTLVHHLGFPVVDVNELGDLYAGIRWKPPYTLEEAREAKRDGRMFVHPFKRMDQLGELAG